MHSPDSIVKDKDRKAIKEIEGVLLTRIVNGYKASFNNEIIVLKILESYYKLMYQICIIES